MTYVFIQVFFHYIDISFFLIFPLAYNPLSFLTKPFICNFHFILLSQGDERSAAEGATRAARSCWTLSSSQSASAQRRGEHGGGASMDRRRGKAVGVTPPRGQHRQRWGSPSEAQGRLGEAKGHQAVTKRYLLLKYLQTKKLESDDAMSMGSHL